MKEPFGRRLARLREAAGLSQTQLADRAGVHRQTIARLEGGEKLPNGTTASAIAPVLGVSVDELLGVKSGRLDASKLVEAFVASGEAAKMVPPASEAELAWLRENPDAFAGPPPTPRATALLLWSLRERPEWSP